MTDISHSVALISEAISNACYDVVETAKKRDAGPPTPFQRAVIGGLVLIAHHSSDFTSAFNSQELGAAQRAIAPFLDETPAVQP